MAKPIKDAKDMLRWFWEMTTVSNIVSTLLFFGALIAIGLFLVGIFLFLQGGYGYVADLYRQADAGGKLTVIVGIGGVFLGVLLGPILSWVKNRFSKH